MSLNAVVFSFDRAAQLELLLRSLRENVAEYSEIAISVLFKTTHAESAAAYDEVSQLHPEVEFASESDPREVPLQSQILRLLDRRPRDHFAFFVDDDVIIEPFSLADAEFARLANPEILSLSLRLHPGVWHCQPTGAMSRPPIMISNRVWNLERRKAFGSSWLEKRWRRLSRFPKGDWSCRFSLDGNIYDYERFRAHFGAFEGFDHVTEIEPTMSRQRAWASRLTCYARPRLVNLAMNRVDVRHEYPCAELSAEEMNAEFRKGFRLDYEHLRGRRFRACHLLEEPVWVPRSRL
jgi:hypothetical protein